MIRVTRSTIIDAPIDRVWAILRDFNSHIDWHPIIAESHIENGEPADQIGCVRNFTLKNGNHIREQLLTLSDSEHVSTYCILDATIPLNRYVATVRLKPVTDGSRTFWHWESTFDPPRGREQEFADIVGQGVYEAGFDAIKAYLRRDGRPAATKPAAGAAIGAAIAGQGVIVTRFGGADVLRFQQLDAPPPGPGEARIRQTAIGVNYIDVYIRTGLYRMITPPAPLGMEAAGVVLDVGEGVAHLLPGDRVGYAAPMPGAYATHRTLSAGHLVPLPDSIDDETAAAVMLKGMSAAYLLHRTRRVKAGERVLVHAAAGGVGLLLCQWAKRLGAIVIGTVSSHEKAHLARSHGCAYPIVTKDYRFADDVRSVTDGHGADVIYDGLGQAAAEENLAALALCGQWVSYGQASGPLDSVTPARLSEKSATFSRPVLFHYTSTRADLTALSGQLFTALSDRGLTPLIGGRWSLSNAAEAHRALESRVTTGSLLLIP